MRPFIEAVRELADINTLNETSFLTGTKAQECLAEIQEHFKTCGGFASMIIDESWIEQWNHSCKAVRKVMLVNYITSELHHNV